MTQNAPANWYPDPYGQYEHRYWDGWRWTEHVATRGVVGIDPAIAGPPAPTDVSPTSATPHNQRVLQQVQRTGAASVSVPGSSALLSERVLVVNQKAKLFGSNADYAVFNGAGVRVGTVREVRRNVFKKAMSTRADEDQTRKFQVLDTQDNPLLRLIRPAKLVKSKMLVSTADGAPLGQIVQKSIGLIGKVRFDIEVSGKTIGTITADGWDAWDFGIQDSTGAECGRITKDWAGAAKEWFTKSDNYVVEIHRVLEDPFRSLVVAAALAVDVALFEGSNDSRHRRRRTFF